MDLARRQADPRPCDQGDGIVERIGKQAERARQGKPSRVRLKANSIVDEAVIDALYGASRAGVPVELVVRGICALRPGVPGVSENISVVSVLGRFLEHSRVFAFERPNEEPAIYIGSADLMPRNLINRVELVIPVEDESIRHELLDVLTLSLADTVGAGDAFTATLAMGLLRGAPLDRINAAANRVAAYVCSQHGATPKLPPALAQEIGA